MPYGIKKRDKEHGNKVYTKINMDHHPHTRMGSSHVANYAGLTENPILRGARVPRTPYDVAKQI
ncbi:hypothetical protein BCR43DRAFT_223474 [Syncephalastrum racemosum]|uniref:Uncharacterized protein n=1 Tax=Syncephalastrum racemosum TaxID=13706 RepID=A0A1X2HKY2_SYNRA|nr:hypothetical protein BCR43DRAFT_223474 [Syncephalastrum racemosum]